jgi:hypothetical protein
VIGVNGSNATPPHFVEGEARNGWTHGMEMNDGGLHRIKDHAELVGSETITVTVMRGQARTDFKAINLHARVLIMVISEARGRHDIGRSLLTEFVTKSCHIHFSATTRRGEVSKGNVKKN